MQCVACIVMIHDYLALFDQWTDASGTDDLASLNYVTVALRTSAEI